MRAVLLACVLAAGVAAAQANSDCTKVDFLPNPFGMDQSPVQGPCSGNGQCVSGVCVCDEGWTGLADFFDTRGQDCQINESITRGLWGFNLLVAIFVSVVSRKRIMYRWAAYKETKAAKLERGEKYGLGNNRGMLAVIIGFGFCVPFVAIMGILRIAKPDERVGFTFGATFMFAMAKIAFYTTAYLFQPALISSILKGQRATQRIVQATWTISGVLSAMGIIAGFLPFITLYGSNGRDDTAVGVWLGVMGLTCLQVLGLGVQAYWTMQKVEKALDMSYNMSKSPRTLKIKNALVDLEKGNIRQAFGQGAVYLLFCLILPMYTVHDYFLPFGWLAYLVIAKKLTESDGRGAAGGTATAGASTLQSDVESNDKGTSSYQESSSPATANSPRAAGSGGAAYPKGTVVRKFQGNVLSFVEVQDSREESQDDGYV